MTHPGGSVALSPEGLEHLRMLMLHRRGDELVIELIPKKCELCQEIEDWRSAILEPR
jgi:hypothetical protein